MTFDDKPRESCGLFGICDHPEAAKMAYFGLYALQHRGQESAGIAVARDQILTSHKNMGLVSDVFSMAHLDHLGGGSAVGHVRYSTTGSSILRNAQEQGVCVPEPGDVDLTLLELPEEKELIRYMAALPDIIEGAAVSLEPHRIATYLRDVATTLHNYYYHHRVLTEDAPVTGARLAMVVGVKTAIARALALLGVSAPERM